MKSVEDLQSSRGSPPPQNPHPASCDLPGYVCQGQTFATTELDKSDKSDLDDDCCGMAIVWKILEADEAASRGKGQPRPAQTAKRSYMQAVQCSSLFCWQPIPLRRNLACWCILPPKMNRVFYIRGGRATVRGSLGLQASGVSTGLWNKLCWESLMLWMSSRISQPRPTAGIGGHLCTGHVNLLWLSLIVVLADRDLDVNQTLPSGCKAQNGRCCQWVEMHNRQSMQDLKLNFLFVVLFAPVVPWAIIPTLLARVMEVRLKITSAGCTAGHVKSLKVYELAYACLMSIYSSDKLIITWSGSNMLKYAQVISVSFNIFQFHDQLYAAKEAFSSSPSQLSPRCSSHSQYSGNLHGALAAVSFALESCGSLHESPRISTGESMGKPSASHGRHMESQFLCLLWHCQLRTWLLRLPFFGIWVFPWWPSTTNFTHGHCQHFFWHGLAVDSWGP